jgi:hypothetical protein
MLKAEQVSKVYLRSDRKMGSMLASAAEVVEKLRPRC